MKFQNHKKGLSTIVATLVIILLVLVAVGIVWVVVRNVIERGTNQVDINAKCIGAEVKVTNVTCSGASGGVCDAVVTRSSGDGEIGGIKLSFTNDAEDSNYIHDEPGNMAPLETKKISGIDTGLTNPSKVSSIVYFIDNSGNEQLCAVSNPFQF